MQDDQGLSDWVKGLTTQETTQLVYNTKEGVQIIHFIQDPLKLPQNYHMMTVNGFQKNCQRQFTRGFQIKLFPKTLSIMLDLSLFLFLFLSFVSFCGCKKKKKNPTKKDLGYINRSIGSHLHWWEHIVLHLVLKEVQSRAMIQWRN